MRMKIGLIIPFLALTAAVAHADTVTLSGYLNDPANAALVYYDLTPALFGDDWEIANNVAIYDLALPVAGNVEFRSLGFGKGGLDPYFTLFEGTGGTATLLGSNYAQAFSTGGDFDLFFDLAAGSYTLAMAVFPNMSFAENLGSGTLADGFLGLASPDYMGNTYYELAVTYQGGGVPSVPEPATWLLVLPGLALIWMKRRR